MLDNIKNALFGTEEKELHQKTLKEARADIPRAKIIAGKIGTYGALGLAGGLAATTALAFTVLPAILGAGGTVAGAALSNPISAGLATAAGWFGYTHGAVETV